MMSEQYIKSLVTGSDFYANQKMKGASDIEKQVFRDEMFRIKRNVSPALFFTLKPKDPVYPGLVTFGEELAEALDKLFIPKE